MDELERRMRASNPAGAGRNAPLSARALSDLDQILSGNVEVYRPAARHRWNLVVGTAAAVIVLLVGVFLVPSLTARPATAVPDPLATRPIDEPDSTVISELIMKASHDENGGGNTQVITRCEWWASTLSVTDDGTQIFVQPQEITRQWSADLSGRITVRTATPRWEAPSDARQAQPGEVLEDTAYEPGTFPLLFTTEPPTDASHFLPYLRDSLGLVDDAVSGDFFTAVQDLRNERELDGQQTAALLGMLAALPNVEVAGEVTDRLGRPGIAIATNDRSNGVFRDVLVFDRATGLLISSETEYLGGLDELQVPYPTVINYFAWKDAQ